MYLNNNDSNHTHNDQKEEYHDTFVSRNLQNACVNFRLVFMHELSSEGSREREREPDDQSLSLTG